MKYADKIFQITDLKNGSKDTALDVKSLAHALNCSVRNAYIIAEKGNCRFKQFVVNATTVDAYVEALNGGAKQ